MSPLTTSTQSLIALTCLISLVPLVAVLVGAGLARQYRWLVPTGDAIGEAIVRQVRKLFYR